MVSTGEKYVDRKNGFIYRVDEVCYLSNNIIPHLSYISLEHRPQHYLDVFSIYDNENLPIGEYLHANFLPSSNA